MATQLRRDRRINRDSIRNNSNLPLELHLDDDRNSIEVLDLLMIHLKEHHNLSSNEIRALIQRKKEPREKEIMIPVSIFNSTLSALETIVKYMNEILNLKNKEISILLNRNVRTVWTTYKNSHKKMPEKLTYNADDAFLIPVSAFTNRIFSTLEIIVQYLVDNFNLSLHEIAEKLHRDDSTIWTVYNRSLRKIKTKPKK